MSSVPVSTVVLRLEFAFETDSRTLSAVLNQLVVLGIPLVASNTIRALLPIDVDDCDDRLRAAAPRSNLERGGGGGGGDALLRRELNEFTELLSDRKLVVAPVAVAAPVAATAAVLRDLVRLGLDRILVRLIVGPPTASSDLQNSLAYTTLRNFRIRPRQRVVLQQNTLATATGYATVYSASLAALEAARIFGTESYQALPGTFVGSINVWRVPTRDIAVATLILSGSTVVVRGADGQLRAQQHQQQQQQQSSSAVQVPLVWPKKARSMRKHATPSQSAPSVVAAQVSRVASVSVAPRPSPSLSTSTRPLAQAASPSKKSDRRQLPPSSSRESKHKKQAAPAVVAAAAAAATETEEEKWQRAIASLPHHADRAFDVSPIRPSSRPTLARASSHGRIGRKP